MTHNKRSHGFADQFPKSYDADGNVRSELAWWISGASMLLMAMISIALSKSEYEIRTLLESLQKNGVHRLVVLTKNDWPLYVIHDSMLHAYLSQPQPSAGEGAQGKTLWDMLQDPDFKPLLASTFGLVQADATLADVKLLMDGSHGTSNWEDVFVTQSGLLEAPILGWITNEMLLKYVNV